MLAVADAVMMSPRANQMSVMIAGVVAPIRTLIVTRAITSLVVAALVGVAAAVVVVRLGDGGRAAEQSQGHRPGEQFGHWKFS